ncbi:MAG: hypothetical protein HQ557_17445 [Bacteroidetes bacterium]|nr:hypothetical protein [Bacteroidota bacterium]
MVSYVSTFITFGIIAVILILIFGAIKKKKGIALNVMEPKGEIKQLCKGRTEDQKKMIKYFLAVGGCLKKGIQDNVYDTILSSKLNSLDLKNRALNKIGLDKSQVKEIDPVNFSYFLHDDTNYAKKGKDNIWRSSKYQSTWLFFSDTQVYVYQNTFSLTDDAKKEKTEEYFYKDITNFSTISDEIEKKTIKTSCNGTVTPVREMVSYDSFSLVVPGGKLECSLKRMEETESIIQGMKAKLREKKNS